MHIHARLYALYAVYVTVTCILNTHIFTYTRTDTCIYTHTPIPQQQQSMGSIKKKKSKHEKVFIQKQSTANSELRLQLMG